MNHELNKNIDDDSSHISLVAQGASVAGMLAFGLGMPSVWRTLKNNFPNGMLESVTSKFIKVRTSEIELLGAISQSAFDTVNSPEKLADVFTSNSKVKRARKAIIDEAEREIMTIESKKPLDKLSSQLDDVFIDQYTNKTNITELTEKVRKAEDRLFGHMDKRYNTSSEMSRGFKNLFYKPNMNKIKIAALADLLVDSVSNNIEIPNKASILKFMNNPQDVSDQAVDRIFENLSKANNVHGKSLSQHYLARLSGTNRYKVTTGEYALGSIGSVMDTISSSKIPSFGKTIKKLNKITLAASDFKQFKPKIAIAGGINVEAIFDVTKSKLDKHGAIQEVLGNKTVVDDFMKKVYTSNPWMQSAGYYKKSDLQIREVLAEVANEVNVRNQGRTLEEATSFKIRLEHPDRAGKQIQIAIDVKKGSKKATTILLPLANQELQVQMTSGIETVSYANWKNNISGPIHRSTEIAKAFGSNKGYISKILREYDRSDNAKWEAIAGLQDLIYESYTTEGLYENPYRNFHTSQKIHTQASDHLFKLKSGAFRKRLAGISDLNVLKMQKKLGRDMFIYDQEYVMNSGSSGGQVGIQITRKNPEKCKPWQISWRRVNGDGTVTSGNTFIKSPELEHAFNTKKGKLYNSFVGVNKNMGYSSERIEQAMSDIMEKGVTMEQAMVDFKRNSAGAVFVDQGGKTGPDRILIDHYSKQYLGSATIGNAAAIDTMEMYKVLSTTRHGHGLSNILSRTLASSSGSEIDKLYGQMINVKGVTHGTNFQHELKAGVKAGANKKDSIIRAFDSITHDARGDTIATFAILDFITKRNPLIGDSGTLFAEIDTTIRRGYMDSKQYINAMNKAMLSRHFVDDGQVIADLEANKWATGLTDVSSNALRGGQMNRTPGFGMSAFALGNSFQKRTDQLWHTSAIQGPSLEGRVAYPFALAMKEVDGMMKNTVAEMMKIHSQGVTRTVALLSKGNALTVDEALFIDENSFKGMFHTFTSPEKRISYEDMVNKKSVVFNGALKDIRLAERYRKRNSHVKKAKDLNWCLEQIYKKRDKQALALEQKITASTGAARQRAEGKLSNMYNIYADQSLLLNDIDDPIFKYDRWQNSRISQLSVDVKQGKIQAINMQLTKLRTMTNDSMPVTKLQVGTGMNAGTTMLADLSRMISIEDPYNITEDMFAKTSDKTKIDVIMEAGHVGRKEGGTFRRSNWLRIYKQMKATNASRGKIENFIKSTFANSNYSFDHNGAARIDMQLGNVLGDIKALNNFNYETIYKFTGESGITWDNKSIKNHMKYYGLDYSKDMTENRRTMEQFTKRKIKEHNVTQNALFKSESIAIGRTVERQIDLNSINQIKADLDPWYNLTTGERTEHARKNPRMHDYLFTQFDGGKKSVIEQGIIYDDIILSRMEHERQGGLLRETKIKVHESVLRTRKTLWSDVEGNTLTGLIDASTGAEHRAGRRNFNKFLSAYSSGKIAANEVIQIHDMNDTVNGIRSTISLKNKADRLKDPSRYYAVRNEVQNAGTTIQFAKDELTHYEELKRKHKGTGNKGMLNRNNERIDELKKQITLLNNKYDMVDHGSSKAEQSLNYNTGTALERIQKNGTGGYHEFSRLEFGKDAQGKVIRMAPSDLMMIKTPGFTPHTSERFFNKLIDKVEEEAKLLGTRNPKEIELLKQQAMMLRNIMGSSMNDGVVLPSFQTMREILNIDYIHEAGSSKYKLTGGTALTETHELLNAINKYSKKPRKQDIGGLEDKLATFISKMITRAGQDKNILQAEKVTELSGIRGIARSQIHLKTRAMLNYTEHYGDFHLSKLKTKGVAEISSEARVAGNLLKNILNPSETWIDKDRFIKLRIQGKSMEEYFYTTVSGSDKDKSKLWNDIVQGKTSMLTMIERPPNEIAGGATVVKMNVISTKKHKLLTGHMTGGIHVGMLHQIGINADFDTDEIAQGLLKAGDIKGYNKLIRATMNRDEAVMKNMVSFLENDWREGSFGDAKSSYLKRNLKASSAELLGIDLAGEFADRGYRVKHGTHEILKNAGKFKADYFIDTLTNEERAVRLLTDSNASDEYLAGLHKQYTVGDIKEKTIRAYKILSTGYASIGDVTAWKRATENRIERIAGFAFKSGGSDNLISKLSKFKYFAGGVDNEMSGILDDIGKSFFTGGEAYNKNVQSIMSEISNVTQYFVSGKKALSEIAADTQIQALNALNNLRDPSSISTLERLGANGRTLKWLAGFEYMEKLLSFNENYRQSAQVEAGFVTSGGMTGETTIKKNIMETMGTAMENMESAEKIDFMKKYAGVYDVGKKNLAQRSSDNWANSIKTMLLGKEHATNNKSRVLSGKKPMFGADAIGGMKNFIYEHNLGKVGGYTMAAVGLLHFLTPNQLDGGITDFGLDIGRSPGRGGETGDIFSFGKISSRSSLKDHVDTDPFSEQWARVIDDNPMLDDYWVNNNFKDYKDLAIAKPKNQKYNGQYIGSSRRYINSHAKISKHYMTNDMRRASIPTF